MLRSGVLTVLIQHEAPLMHARSTSFAFVLVAAALLATAAALPADAARRHLALVKSTPMADSAVAKAPSEITLWFSESVELGVTRVRLAGPDATPVKLGALRRTGTAEPLAISADLTGALANGSYTVSWSTSSKDGHAVRGTFKFTVAAH